MKDPISFLPLLLSTAPLVGARRPNMIVMQPDDFQFLAHWPASPAHFPTTQNPSDMPSSLVPNLERLSRDGLTMQRGYAVAPECAPSRFSTLTGRYPSRSAFSRNRENAGDLVTVSVPRTKLVDIDGVSDCSKNNIAVLLRENGYRTGFMGKWHLGDTSRTVGATYADQQAVIQSCGFDTAESIVWERLVDGENHKHNLEHLTAEALKFLDTVGDQEFFLYFNPTAPHTMGDVYESLTQFSCRNTPSGILDEDPIIPGMTEGLGCEAYRQTVLDRGGTDTSNHNLGSIWVDDTVGALLLKLESIGQLNNTLFLFQTDHGMEGKGTLYEPGVRIAQYVHYPDMIAPGTEFSGLVSTIDIAPTLAAYANITTDSPGWYPMDGVSWKSQLEGRVDLSDRCIVAEADQDRAIICECQKMIEVDPTSPESSTLQRGRRYGVASGGDYDLCSAAGYVTSPELSQEASNVVAEQAVFEFGRLHDLLECHNAMTVAGAPIEFGTCDALAGIAAVASNGGTVPQTPGALELTPEASTQLTPEMEEGAFAPTTTKCR